MDENEFGGRNPNFVYTPMTEVEQEVVSRLVESGELVVILHGWGFMENLAIVFGDARISIPIKLTFHAPETPIAVPFFDLELRTRSGITLFREKQSTMTGGQPLQVCEGVTVEMIWDIGIRKLDPGLVKLIKPGATGLTSRLIDKDTGDETLTGNMSLSNHKKNLLQMVREGEARVRKFNQDQVAELEKKP